jgi:hypothetical protein
MAARDVQKKLGMSLDELIKSEARTKKAQVRGHGFANSDSAGTCLAVMAAIASQLTPSRHRE